MYLTDLEKAEEVDMTPEEMTGTGRLTVRWLLGEPEGAPNFEMRYFALSGEIATEWHSHDWEHQVFVVKGKGKFRSREKEVKLEPGSALFVAPGEEHHFICDGKEFDFICVVPKGTRTCMPCSED
jgi:quercetin dioxygenase-like cupin family protein